MIIFDNNNSNESNNISNKNSIISTIFSTLENFPYEACAIVISISTSFTYKVSNSKYRLRSLRITIM